KNAVHQRAQTRKSKRDGFERLCLRSPRLVDAAVFTYVARIPEVSWQSQRKRLVLGCGRPARVPRRISMKVEDIKRAHSVALVFKRNLIEPPGQKIHARVSSFVVVALG